MNFFDNIKGKLKKYLSDVGFSGIFGKSVIDLSDLLNFISVKPVGMPEDTSDFIVALSDTLGAVENIANNRDFSIGVIGAYSSGKSSFINALIGRDILPVSARACTALITRVRYGQVERAVITSEGGEDSILPLDKFKEFSSYTLNDIDELERTGSVSRLAGIKKVELYVNSRFLKKNRISLLDTPGLGANEIDNIKTREALRETIAIFFIAPFRGLSSNDKEVLKGFAKNSCDNIFIAFNKADLISDKGDREEVIALTKLVMQQLQTDLGISNLTEDKQRIFLVSSKYESQAFGMTEEEDEEEEEIKHRHLDREDFSVRSGFMDLRAAVRKYIDHHTQKARLEYLGTQFDGIKQQVGAFNSQREVETKSAIYEKEVEIKKLEQDLETVRREIALIQARYSSILEEFPMRYLAHYETSKRDFTEKWEGATERIISEIKFDNSLYLDLWQNDRFLFRSKTKKAEKAVALLDSLTTGVVNYLKDILLGEMSILVSGMRTMTIERIKQYQLIEDKEIESQMTLSWDNIVPVGLKIGDNEDITLTFNSIIRNVSLALRDTIREQRSVFTVMNAQVHKLFKSEKNNRKRIADLLSFARIKGEEEIETRSEEIKNILFSNLKKGVEILKDHSLKPYLETDAKLKKRIKLLQSSISALEKRRTIESDYFGHIIRLLEEKEQNVNDRLNSFK